MAYRVWLGTMLLVAGCASRVILSDDDVEATSDTDTDTATETAASSDGGSDGPSPGTGEPPMPTVGPMSTTGPTTLGSSGFDSSGFVGSSSGGSQPLCWSVQPLFEAPEESRLHVRDQDGDGLEELWLGFFDGGGPGGQTDLFWFDATSEPLFAGSFPGFFTGWHDINGDDVLEAMGFSFGGGPPRLGYIEGSPFSVQGPVLQTPFDFEDGFEAFADLDSDGLGDFLSGGDGMISLLAGDGAGGFQPTSSVASGLAGGLVVRPVRGNVELFAVSETSFFDDLFGCSEHALELLTVNGKQLAFTTSSGSFSSFFPTEVIGAEQFGPFTNIYTRACFKDQVTLQVHRFDGGAAVEVEDYASSSFVALGDFDGNGLRDVALGGLGLDSILTYNGTVAGVFTFGGPLDVVFGEPVPSRVFVVDIDADGREEIILGTRDGGPELVYQRLDLDPC